MPYLVMAVRLISRLLAFASLLLILYHLVGQPRIIPPYSHSFPD